MDTLTGLIFRFYVYVYMSFTKAPSHGAIYSKLKPTSTYFWYEWNMWRQNTQAISIINFVPSVRRKIAKNFDAEIIYINATAAI